LFNIGNTTASLTVNVTSSRVYTKIGSPVNITVEATLSVSGTVSTSTEPPSGTATLNASSTSQADTDHFPNLRKLDQEKWAYHPAGPGFDSYGDSTDDDPAANKRKEISQTTTFAGTVRSYVYGITTGGGVADGEAWGTVAYSEP
jgi:hypothetical protein